MMRALIGVISVLGMWLSTAPSPGAQAKEPDDMVRVPGGAFSMGRDDGPADERPQHRVEVAEFVIDRNKVTNGAFATFLNVVGARGPHGEKYYDIEDNDARVHRRDGKWLADAGHERHPVVEASWDGARVLRVGRQALADRTGMGEGGARHGRTEVSMGERSAR